MFYCNDKEEKYKLTYSDFLYRIFCVHTICWILLRDFMSKALRLDKMIKKGEVKLRSPKLNLFNGRMSSFE